MGVGAAAMLLEGASAAEIAMKSSAAIARWKWSVAVSSATNTQQVACRSRDVFKVLILLGSALMRGAGTALQG
jgi:hypothetical protein